MPLLERDVLDAVRPGDVVLIPLEPEQRKQLSDDEGRLALSLLQHTLAARPDPSARLPFAGGFVQRVSRMLGQAVGEHKALRIVRRLTEAGVLSPAGSYRQAYNTRQPSGFRVRLFRLRTLLRNTKSSVRRASPRRPWWTHPLFGFGSKSFPEWLPKYLKRCHPPP